MTQPITMESVHAVVAAITGELSLAIERKKGSKAQMADWIRRMRGAADAFEAKLILAKGAPREPDPKCMLCEGSGVYEGSPEEFGWRADTNFLNGYHTLTDTGLNIPVEVLTLRARCPCTNPTGG